MKWGGTSRSTDAHLAAASLYTENNGGIFDAQRWPQLDFGLYTPFKIFDIIWLFIVLLEEKKTFSNKALVT